MFPSFYAIKHKMHLNTGTAKACAPIIALNSWSIQEHWNPEPAHCNFCTFYSSVQFSPRKQHIWTPLDSACHHCWHHRPQKRPGTQAAWLENANSVGNFQSKLCYFSACDSHMKSLWPLTSSIWTIQINPSTRSISYPKWLDISCKDLSTKFTLNFRWWISELNSFHCQKLWFQAMTNPLFLFPN